MKSQLVPGAVTLARKLTENGALPELGAATSRNGASAFLPTFTWVWVMLRIAAMVNGRSR